MDPPDHSIQTTAVTIWADGDIVWIRSKGIPSTPDTVVETMTTAGDLIDGTARKALLFDGRNWPGPTGPDSWAAFIPRVEKLFLAVAFLLEPETAASIGSFPEAISRLLIPFQVFTDETEALAFLRGFLPDE